MLVFTAGSKKGDTLAFALPIWPLSVIPVFICRLCTLGLPFFFEVLYGLYLVCFSFIFKVLLDVQLFIGVFSNFFCSSVIPFLSSSLSLLEYYISRNIKSEQYLLRIASYLSPKVFFLSSAPQAANFSILYFMGTYGLLKQSQKVTESSLLSFSRKCLRSLKSSDDLTTE